MKAACPKFYLIMSQSVFFLGAFSSVEASNIEKPAGALPVPRTDQPLSGQSLGLSKSKVVPLKRKMDLASGTTFKAHQPKAKPAKVSVLASTEQNHAEDSAGESHATGTDQADQNPASGGDQAVWDSANKRYNEGDTSKAAPKTVRVEDIIEPSVDYRYSSARRKNPFIPEIVLSGQITDCP